MRSITKAVLAIAVSAIACASFAQGGGGGGGRGFGGGQRGMMGGGAADSNGYNLLQRADVQGELALTTEQKGKLDTIRTEQREAMREMFQNGGGGGDREAMMKEMQKFQEGQNKKFAAVLTADQIKRLKELAIQRAGFGAVNFPDVAKAVGLTDEQKAKIKELQGKQQEAMQGLMEKMRAGEIERTEIQGIMKKNTDAMNTEMGKILTDDQKSKLKEMGGKAFTFKEEERRGGGGGL
jgi:hypothetical protein